MYSIHTEEAVIAKCNPDWMNQTKLHLPEGYNFRYDVIDYYENTLGWGVGRKDEKQIKIVHFNDNPKPWKYKNMVQYSRKHGTIDDVSGYWGKLAKKGSARERIEDYYNKIKDRLGIV
jgi:lipopolysaccharide biosynthesis glycosyltransferase